MSIVKLFPKVFKLAMLYSKAVKLTSNSRLSKQEVLEKVYKLEQCYGGRNVLISSVPYNSWQSKACIIGKKDMGRIYSSINAFEDAICYLESALTDIETKLKHDQNIDLKFYVENKCLILIYYALSKTQLQQYQLSKSIYDEINIFLNEEVSKNPSNQRLYELYIYSIDNMYHSYIQLAKKNPETAQYAYKDCYDLLTSYLKRDPGNERIENYINKFK